MPPWWRFNSCTELVRMAEFMIKQRETRDDGCESEDGIRLRMPTAEDGVAVAKLIADCPPLDTNSIYCNLLQCTDFADTCILAERGGDVVGWISGYRPPAELSTLFIWQVAVHAKARGCGLARRMLEGLMKRPATSGVSHMKTTITPDNDGSHALFRSFAKRCDAPLRESAGFDKEAHFNGLHDSERLITIGPIPGHATQGSASLFAA